MAITSQGMVLPDKLQRRVAAQAFYYAELRKKYPNSVVPIVSIQHVEMERHRAGILFLVPIELAALYFAKHTHREATDEEYQSYLEEQDEKADAAEAARIEALLPAVVSRRAGRPKSTAPKESPAN